MADKRQVGGINQNSAEALAIAFERGLLTIPDQEAPATPTGEQDGNARWLVMNATLLPASLAQAKPFLVCEQGFRPQFLALQAAGYDVHPLLPVESGRYDHAIVFAGRVRKANETNLGRAWKMVRPGGMIIMAGEKTTGIKSLRKWVERLTGVAGSFSKHHAQLFWILRTGDAWPSQPSVTATAGYVISPGSFSAGGPDTGSQILAGHFDSRISGSIADFGAGWGYLGMQLLQKAGTISRFDSYEADWLSLKAAEANLQAHAYPHDKGFVWLDLRTEKVTRSYDWIIMNPPFHISRASQPAIGTEFIAAAANALKPDGRLLMVANRDLPYKDALAAAFGSVRVLEERDGFKVIEAKRKHR